MRRFKLFLAALAATAGMAVAIPATSDAYLHQANAWSACGSQMKPYTDAWFAANSGGQGISYTGGPWYHRYSDSQIVVHVAWLGQNQRQIEVRCNMVGSDASPVNAWTSGYPYYSWYGVVENYPYVPCGGTPWGNWCLHDPGFG